MRFLTLLAGAFFSGAPMLLAPPLALATPARDGVDQDRRAQDRLAANMRDVQGHFAQCIQPPDGDAQVIFYFSMKSDGALQGRPRIVWYGDKDEPQQERTTLLSEYRDAIEQCMPVHLDEHMASTIPGKVYLLKITVADHKADVLIRPYGSMGPPLVDHILPY